MSIPEEKRERGREGEAFHLYRRVQEEKVEVRDP